MDGEAEQKSNAQEEVLEALDSTFSNVLFPLRLVILCNSDSAYATTTADCRVLGSTSKRSCIESKRMAARSIHRHTRQLKAFTLQC